MGFIPPPMDMRVSILSILVLVTLPFSAMAQEATNPKQEATDAMFYSTLISFANTITFGITSDAIRENGMSFTDGQMYWRGVAIAPLSDAEQKGVNVGQLIGRIAGVLFWAGIIGLIVWLKRKRRISKT